MSALFVAYCPADWPQDAPSAQVELTIMNIAIFYIEMPKTHWMLIETSEITSPELVIKSFDKNGSCLLFRW